MKIAILHNFMDNIGGAEIVGLTLARELGADLYTTNIDQEKVRKMGFGDIKIKSIGKTPINAPFRQQVTLTKFRKLNLGNKYDYYIINGDWAMSGAVNNKPNLWYVHSPMREIWDCYEFSRQRIVPWYFRYAFDAWVYYNRRLIKKYLKDVSRVACLSENTRQRIKTFLNREAQVVYPPTDISKFYFQSYGNYWLSVNRLFIHKRIDLQMKAFAAMPEEKLIVVGSYEQSRHFKQHADYIKKIKPANVEILSWVDFNELIKLYANCKGLIATAQGEDFGLTPIEAMASGKPVIAPNEGGYRETIIDNITGKLINDINVEKLIEAIKEVGRNPEIYKQACLKQARKFDIGEFIKKIKGIISYK